MRIIDVTKFTTAQTVDAPGTVLSDAWPASREDHRHGWLTIWVTAANIVATGSCQLSLETSVDGTTWWPTGANAIEVAAGTLRPMTWDLSSGRYMGSLWRIVSAISGGDSADISDIRVTQL